MNIDPTQPVQRAKGVVHQRIAEIAKGCAEAQWEQLAKQNAFFKRWPKPKPFVVHNWPKYIPVARQILTGMLGDPKYTDAQKQEIYDILLLDGAVNPKTMAEPAKPVFIFNDTKGTR
jgi:hypothetical protein